jgi:hypothetical protein
MKLSAQLVAALVLAGTSAVPAPAPELGESETVAYRVDLIGTDNLPREAYDAVLADPETSLQAVVTAFPGSFFINPGGDRRGLLRGGDTTQGDDDRPRLLIRICGTKCFRPFATDDSDDSSGITTNDTATNFTGNRRRELEVEGPSVDPNAFQDAFKDLETDLSRALTETMCGELEDCGVQVKLTRL